MEHNLSPEIIHTKKRNDLRPPIYINSQEYSKHIERPSFENEFSNLSPQSKNYHFNNDIADLNVSFESLKTEVRHFEGNP